MRITLSILIGIGLAILNTAQARPVSYPGGWTLMLMNNSERNSAHIHYSPTAKTSVGYRFEYWRNKELTLNTIQMNNLLKRWNKPDAQANLYLKSGIGIADSDSNMLDDKTRAAGFIGFATDWENRRYFISYENRYTDTEGIDDFFQQSTRVGWAPYEGDYGDLHTWLMLEVKHVPEADDKFTVTPLIRFFKGVHLLEVGANDNEKILFNYIFRY